jgi:hypothetical protein
MKFEIPFERAENETDTQWSACLTYVSLPTTMRSIRNAELMFKGKNETSRPGKADGKWESWSSTYKWKERASKVDELRLKNFMEEERQSWIKARDDYNKVGDQFRVIQVKLLIGFGKKLEKDPPRTWQQWTLVCRIFESMAKSDTVIWKRYLQSIGIESLLEKDGNE